MKARGQVRKLLIAIRELQSLIGTAKAFHENDRDPNGYVKGQAALTHAFELCLDATGGYEPMPQRKERKPQ
jgi:hypothetical protein